MSSTAVLKGAGATVTAGIAGESVTAGQTAYLKSDGLWYKAKALSGGTAELAGSGGFGIFLTGAAAVGQPVQVQTGGLITIGGTVVKGTSYYLSKTNAGGFSAFADLASGDWVTIVGYATTTGILQLQCLPTGLTI